jgi:hypothetical protein
MTDHSKQLIPNRRAWCQQATLAGGALLWGGQVQGVDPIPGPLKLNSPQPRQVIQREGYQAAHAHEHEQGGPQLGHAEVNVQGTWSGSIPARLEARAILHDGCTGRALGWTMLGDVKVAGDFNFKVMIPAGGWYRLEVRAVAKSGAAIGQTEVNPIGIGEVFLISGQSYAAGANDELQRVEDPLERSVLLDYQAKSWRTAHDPFPHVDNGGTIWPAFANAIQPILRVPVGLVNVAVGGTASRQWLPGEDLYRRFAEGGKAAGRFRFVLWQQGESDVIENIATATYVDRLQIIHAGLDKEWGFSPRWLLAKSTLHPTVYRKPVEEARIREAIDQLWKRPGFGQGPDTDILAGENRGGVKSRRHFSPVGQRRAGLMWFASVWAAMHGEPKQ